MYQSEGMATITVVNTQNQQHLSHQYDLYYHTCQGTNANGLCTFQQTNWNYYQLALNYITENFLTSFIKNIGHFLAKTI